LTPISLHTHHPADEVVRSQRRIIPKAVVAAGNDLDHSSMPRQPNDAMGREPPRRPSEDDVADQKGRRRSLHEDCVAVMNGGVHGVAVGDESRRVAGIEDCGESGLEHVKPPSHQEACG
jgi:hypothetical protein